MKTKHVLKTIMFEGWCSYGEMRQFWLSEMILSPNYSSQDFNSGGGEGVYHSLALAIFHTLRANISEAKVDCAPTFSQHDVYYCKTKVCLIFPLVST